MKLRSVKNSVGESLAWNHFCENWYGGLPNDWYEINVDFKTRIVCVENLVDVIDETFREEPLDRRNES